MKHEPAPGPAIIAVDAIRLNELTNRYSQYRRSLTAPADPVKTLILTGAVLEAVRQVIPTAGPHTERSRGT